MNYNPTLKEIFNMTDYTYLPEVFNEDEYKEFMDNYSYYKENNLDPKSICINLEVLKKIENKSNINNLCLVINFPHADKTKEEIAEEIRIASEYNAEIDLVFPSKNFINKGIHKELIELLDFYKNEINKYNFKVIKMIFETSYYVSEHGNKMTELLEACDLTYNYLYSDNYKLFFKTSTGKVFSEENHDKAVKAFEGFIRNQLKTNIGIKISGNVKTFSDVMNYCTLLQKADHLIKSDLLRIGASSLLKNLKPLKENSKDSGY